MERLFFPCRISGPDGAGWYCVVVPGPNVNAQGRTEAEALIEAAEILQDVLEDCVRDGEALPAPADGDIYSDDFPRVGVIQAVIPAAAA
ncbi:MAG: hypothetical protein AAFW69_12610 [Pseudomonadota bacterium]